VATATVERLSVAFNVETGPFVHDHSADRFLVRDFDSFMIMFLSWFR